MTDPSSCNDASCGCSSFNRRSFLKTIGTSAEGWGTFSQKLEGKTMKAFIDLKHGKLRVETIALAAPAAKSAEVLMNGKQIAATFASEGKRLLITPAAGVNLQANNKLEVFITT